MTAFYSTGDVARFCGVSSATVVDWCSEGYLECHRLDFPGSDRRISRAALERFMRASGIPMGNLTGEGRSPDDCITTGEAGALVGVTAKAIGLWCNKGVLTCYRLPGSMDRRVHRNDILQVSRSLGVTSTLTYRVLYVACEPCLPSCVAGLATATIEARTAPTPFQAGQEMAAFRPQCVVIDFSIGRADALAIAPLIRKMGNACLVALVNEDEGDEAEVERAGFIAVMRKPVEPSTLSAWIGARVAPVPAKGKRRKAR